MKANVANLIKAVELSAKAKKAEFYNWMEGDYQIAVGSESPATICDIKGIVGAFAKNTNVVEVGWGCTTIYMDEIEFRDNVDVKSLKMYLPYGWVEKEKWS